MIKTNRAKREYSRNTIAIFTIFSAYYHATFVAVALQGNSLLAFLKPCRTVVVLYLLRYGQRGL